MTSTTISPAIEEAAPAASQLIDGPSRLDRRDALALLGVILLTTIVFANGLRGGFILDDQKQIVRNDLIRLPQFWTTALTSDVWAFQGEKDTPWSNYWRPGHVAWLILNYQLFGPNPFAWHVTNLLAHLGVVACAYVVIRWLRATWAVTLSIVALFAVHPTRVESVTWIAGVHDVLSALAQLVALLALMSIWRRDANREPLDTFGRTWRWTVAIVCYGFAVITKEIAIFFPLIVFLVRFTDPGLRRGAGQAAGLGDPNWARAILPAVPFAAVAALFLLARFLVLGRTQLAFPGQPSFSAAIATLPLVIAYYLRQILLPWWIAWSYPVRVVTHANLGLWTFWSPLALLIGAVAAARRLVRGRLAIVGAAILVLTLLPALNIRALHPEQLVKDRYLYLPLLGFLMLLVPPVAAGLRTCFGPRQATLVGGHVLAIVVVLLSIRTIQYNFAWRSELNLWQWTVRMDPYSATNHELLATAYMHRGPEHYPEARRHFDRALELYPHLTDAYINRAELALRERRFDDAAADCRLVLDRFPDHARAYERLIIAREGQGRLDEATELCRAARDKIRYRRAVFTDKLAVLLVKQNRRAEALAELEAVRGEAETDFSPGSRMVLFHLGMLYGELGRISDATAALRRFLELTEGTADPNLIGPRQTAQRVLRRVR